MNACIPKTHTKHGQNTRPLTEIFLQVCLVTADFFFHFCLLDMLGGRYCQQQNAVEHLGTRYV